MNDTASESSTQATSRAAQRPTPGPALREVEETAYQPRERDDEYPLSIAAQNVDRMVRAGVAHMTAGISPVALWRAYADWTASLALAPGKQADLAYNGWLAAARFASYATHSLAGDVREPVIEPQPGDKRFDDQRWAKPPFNLYKQGFLLTQQWWHNATRGVRGVSDHHSEVVSFVARQLLDIWSPSNFLGTNPQLIDATIQENGMNLVRGAQNFAEDWECRLTGRKRREAAQYRPGREVAVTPGKVVHRNRLMELIQYAPATDKVHPEPVLIVPAWIMKYYILDLSSHNSLIRYLNEQGHTVFCVSWRNPGAEDRELGMQDYRRMGVMEALTAIGAIVPERKIHALGYCLGGTLMAIAAASMARDGDDRLATLTLLAAQTDFTEAGELGLFIDTSQVSFLEDMMWSQGYLDTRQMAGAFTLLRSNDLFWSRLLHEYFLGRRPDKNDLMAWNADTTRMPYRMHSEYLRRLFHENQLARGKFEVEGRPVALTDIRVPIFALGTAKDHVAPWKSVYKVHLLTEAPTTFLLTSGGHNGGIVTPPGHPRRIYQVSEVVDHENYVDPERWRLNTAVHKGSWWPEYRAWLAAHSGAPVAPPSMGNHEAGYPPIVDAPGTYVHQD